MNPTACSKSVVLRDNLWAEEHRDSRFDATGQPLDSRAVVRNDATRNRMRVDDMRHHDTNACPESKNSCQRLIYKH